MKCPMCGKNFQGQSCNHGRVAPDRRGRLNADQTITPVLNGRDAENFRKLFGVCKVEGCNNVEGHEGEHS